MLFRMALDLWEEADAFAAFTSIIQTLLKKGTPFELQRI
jgi:hypothetical protein